MGLWQPIQLFDAAAQTHPKDLASPDGNQRVGQLIAFVQSVRLECGVVVPILGLMEVLAASRLLADTDVLGGDGKNAGFVVERDGDDGRGRPLAVRVVKVRSPCAAAVVPGRHSTPARRGARVSFGATVAAAARCRPVTYLSLPLSSQKTS